VELSGAGPRVLHLPGRPSRSARRAELLRCYKHRLCAECATHLVKDSAARTPMELTVAESQAAAYWVGCPVPGCGSAPFTPLTLRAGLVTDKNPEGAAALRSLAEAQGRLKEMLAMAARAQEDEATADMIRMNFREADGNYRAYMCKQCHFGPIEHAFCSDLRAHHNQQMGGGTRINNACPDCGWFSRRIADWPKWDGVAVGRPQKETKEKKVIVPEDGVAQVIVPVDGVAQVIVPEDVVAQVIAPEDVVAQVIVPEDGVAPTPMTAPRRRRQLGVLGRVRASLSARLGLSRI